MAVTEPGSKFILLGAVLIGLALLGGAWLATANLFGASYSISELEVIEQQPESAEVIEYRELPPEAQRAFDSARRDESPRHTIWEPDHEAAVDSLLQHDIIRYEGQLYEYTMIHGDHIGVGILGIVPFVFGVAGLLVAFYGLDKRYGLSQP